MKRESKKDKNKQLVVKIAEPQDPKCLPNKPAKHEPIIDKNTNNKYIFSENDEEIILLKPLFYVTDIVFINFVSNGIWTHLAAVKELSPNH